VKAWNPERHQGYIGRTVKRAFKLFLSLLVTAAFFWLAFRNTNWKEQWASLRAANYLWLLPYLATLLTIHVLRTLRWGCLLSGMEKVPFRALNEASGIGFMMLILLPFRLGEFARPYLIAQRSGIRKSAAMTSVVLERITDGILIAVLLRALLFFIPDTAPQVGLVRFAGNTMFAIFTGGLAFLLFSLWHQARAVALVRGTLGRLSPKAAERAAGIVDTFVGAMRQLPSRGQMALFFLYTAGYWGLNGWGMSFVSRAFGESLRLSTFEGFAVMCVLVVGVMIPAAPGMAGTFQMAVYVGVGLFVPAAVASSSGLAYANVVWLSQTTAQIGVGLVLMGVSHLSFRELAGKLSSEGNNGGNGNNGTAAPPASAA
jgi:hypothetical protein